MSFHFAWRLLYNKFAWMFDFVSGRVSRGNWKAWGRTSLSYLQHKRVLELAHGPGHLLTALKTAGYQPVGIDLSPHMGRLASRRLRRAGLRVPLVRCRAQALPFRSSSFDDAVATFPTDYILDVNSLREAARVTSPWGRLAIVAGAQRTGSQPDPHFTDWLRRLTGQNGDEMDRQKSVFVQAGWAARIEHQSVEGSPVTLVIAENRLGRESTSAPFEVQQGARQLALPQSRGEKWAEAVHRKEAAIS